MTAKRRRFNLIFAVILAAGVLVTDILVELGVAAAIAYLAVVWLAYAAGSARAVWAAAAVCSLLTIAGMFLSPDGGEIWKVLGNRALALSAIVVTAVLCSRVLRLLAAQSQRAEAAVQANVELARHREVDRRRARALASIMDDLQNERRHLAEEIQQRRAAEARFRATIESAPTAMVMMDESRQIVLVNAMAEKLFGYSRDELHDHTFDLLVPEPWEAQPPALGHSVVERLQASHTDEGRDLFGLRKDGSKFPVEIGLNPVQTEESLYLLSTILDISARRRFEAEQRQLQQELERRVTERTRELAESKQALEQSNVELRQFAYVASHDLQSPLRAVAGFAQFLQRDFEGKLGEKADEWLYQIVDGCKRMQQLINDLLEYSRVESRSRPFQPVDMNRVLDDAVSVLSSSILSSGGTVTRDQLPTVMGDWAQFSQLFQNLIGNALKYKGEAPPHVHISAVDDERQWTVSVRDNGIGIQEKHFQRIFEIFRRLHTQAKYPGTGIGLAICQRIVRHHGGRIWVESKVGQGSTFCFTIPKEPRPV